MNAVNLISALPHFAVWSRPTTSMIMVSHLTRPGGRGHEDGAVGLGQLRSSHSLARLADAAIGLQKDPEDPDSDIRFVRVLKNPTGGAIGDAGTLLYNRETGRLQEFELSLLAADQEDEEAQNDNQDNQPHSTSRGHEQATVGDEVVPPKKGKGSYNPKAPNMVELMDEFDLDDPMLTMEEYANEAMNYAIYPDALIYPMLGLQEEVGELSGKLKRYFRKTSDVSMGPWSKCPPNCVSTWHGSAEMYWYLQPSP